MVLEKIAGMNKITGERGSKNVFSSAIELSLVLALGGLIVVTFFSDRRATTFELICLGLLLIWRFLPYHKTMHPLPKSLILWTTLYLLSYLLGAFLSIDRHWELTEYRRYSHFFIAGLLFTTPLSNNHRKVLITFFFLCAAMAGMAGILQFSGFLPKPDSYAPHGFSPHPILYAALLAFACGSAIIMLFSGKNGLYQTRTGQVFLLISACLTLGGIISSESRGVWIALVTACTVTLFLYDRKKTLIFLSVTMTVMTICFFNNSLRQRAISLVTSIYAEDEKGSAGNRFELWKGSLLIFKERPLLGVGTGNFEPNIIRLVQEGKLKTIPSMVHAHNIFLQALATRGIIGLALTVGLLIVSIKWGMKEIESHRGIGGYTIVLCLVLTVVGGLTENNIENGKFLAALCLTIGLIGPYGADQTKPKLIGSKLSD